MARPESDTQELVPENAALAAESRAISATLCESAAAKEPQVAVEVDGLHAHGPADEAPVLRDRREHGDLLVPDQLADLLDLVGPGVRQVVVLVGHDVSRRGGPPCRGLSRR
ncbi:hypothetical protein M2316_003578 [Cellulosimicrobium cellulans]|nr:hypothetical protein [Cellulosimicrobium cellulans]